jgi:hypothetical protein
MLTTSIELPVARDEPIRSSAHAELSCGISDWDAVYPVHQMRLQVSSMALDDLPEAPEDPGYDRPW